MARRIGEPCVPRTAWQSSDAHLTLQFPFPGQKPLGLLVDLFLAAGGPRVQLILLPDQFCVVLDQLAPQRLELGFSLGELGVGQPVVFGQLRPDLPQRTGERGRRRRPGQLNPELFGGQPDLERLTVHSP